MVVQLGGHGDKVRGRVQQLKLRQLRPRLRTRQPMARVLGTAEMAWKLRGAVAAWLQGEMVKQGENRRRWVQRVLR